MTRPTLLVTGGTRGLGLACARHMAKAGWDIALSDLSDRACRVYGEAESVEQILEELEGMSARARFYPADLTREIQAQKMVRAVERDFGKMDGLVAMAGGDIRGTDPAAAGRKPSRNTAFIPWKDLSAVFDRNFLTCLFACRAGAARMRARRKGRIVTVSTTLAGHGVETETAYAVSKSAVLHFTRCLATELRPFGVQVNCVAPGATGTGRFRSTLKGRRPEDLIRLQGKSRLERLAQPEDVCRVIEFFLSPASGFVSGQVLRVDGGQFTSPI